MKEQNTELRRGLGGTELVDLAWHVYYKKVRSTHPLSLCVIAQQCSSCKPLLGCLRLEGWSRAVLFPSAIYCLALKADHYEKTKLLPQAMKKIQEALAALERDLLSTTRWVEAWVPAGNEANSKGMLIASVYVGPNASGEEKQQVHRQDLLCSSQAWTSALCHHMRLQPLVEKLPGHPTSASVRMGKLSGGSRASRTG